MLYISHFSDNRKVSPKFRVFWRIFCENPQNIFIFAKIIQIWAKTAIFSRYYAFAPDFRGKEIFFSQNFQNITSSKYYVKMIPVLTLLINIAFCNKIQVKINICYFLRRFLWKLYVFFRKSFSRKCENEHFASTLLRRQAITKRTLPPRLQ